MQSLAEVVGAHARARPEALAFAEGEQRLDWAAYDTCSDGVAAALVAAGLGAGDRVAVLHPDGPAVHAAYLGCEKAGCVVMGIGPRAGPAEVRHLLARSGARALLAPRIVGDLDLHALVSEIGRAGRALEHLDFDPLAPPQGLPAAPASRRLGSHDVFLLNSTSGTTGLPKCVVHDQARWLAFHELAVEAGALTGDDVFLSALPAPFGFGLWTAHFTPTLLGAPCVLMERFDADGLVRAIARHRVTVLAAVSTQFIMMLNAPALAGADLSSLRVLFTGGEAVPYERAAAFEDRTGARVLQFYGSNETGALSRTRLGDPREVRLRTAGRVIPSMQVRLFDEAGADVTHTGRGQPGCKGPLLSRGYHDDDGANRSLYTPDGWMLTGDVCTLEGDVLTVVGRTADFIIRGGKNISAGAVEAAVAEHPAVSVCAAVAMPDPVFGERVCAYVELVDGAGLDLPALQAHLATAGLSKEWWPEHLVVLPELPRSSGGKVAKGALREDARHRAAEA